MQLITMGKTPYVEFLELRLRRRGLTFDVEVQLVMKHHRAAASLEQNQISHLRQRARRTEHSSVKEN